MKRRALIQSGLPMLLFGQVSRAADPPATPRPPIFQQDLPDFAMRGWSVTAVEVKYAPGQASTAHRHPGFVLGYVLEGEIEFQLAGQTKTTYGVGQMFYEPPGAAHLVKPFGALAQFFLVGQGSPPAPRLGPTDLASSPGGKIC